MANSNNAAAAAKAKAIADKAATAAPDVADPDAVNIAAGKLVRSRPDSSVEPSAHETRPDNASAQAAGRSLFNPRVLLRPPRRQPIPIFRNESPRRRPARDAYRPSPADLDRVRPRRMEARTRGAGRFW